MINWKNCALLCILSFLIGGWINIRISFWGVLVAIAIIVAIYFMGYNNKQK